MFHDFDFVYLTGYATVAMASVSLELLCDQSESGEPCEILTRRGGFSKQTNRL